MADFDVIWVPTYTGNEKGYTLGYSRINNGNVGTVLQFAISEKGLNRFIETQPPTSSPENNRSMLEATAMMFKSNISKIIEVMVRKYGGFPSQSINSENIMICFDILDGKAVHANVSKDLKKIVIWIDIDMMAKGRYNEIFMPLRHEIYHVIAQAQHSQHKMGVLIQAWKKRLDPYVEKNKRTMSKGIIHFLEYSRIGENISRDEARTLVLSFQKFFDVSYEQFHNMVADSALCIIAMEIEDIDYINERMSFDRQDIVQLKNNLAQLEAYYKHARKLRDYDHPEFSLVRAMYIRSVLNAMSFVYFFNHLPINAIAIHALSRSEWGRDHPYVRYGKYYAYANKVVEEYKEVIKKHFNIPNEGFLKFFEAYASIAQAQAIHINPNDPNVKQEMYNKGAMVKANEAFKILNGQFYFWMSTIEKNEKAWVKEIV